MSIVLEIMLAVILLPIMLLAITTAVLIVIAMFNKKEKEDE